MFIIECEHDFVLPHFCSFNLQFKFVFINWSVKVLLGTTVFALIDREIMVDENNCLPAWTGLLSTAVRLYPHSDYCSTSNTVRALEYGFCHHYCVTNVTLTWQDTLSSILIDNRARHSCYLDHCYNVSCVVFNGTLERPSGDQIDFVSGFNWRVRCWAIYGHWPNSACW